VLIGTAEQNALVARMAERLPARYEGSTLRLGDGTREPSQNTALGLVHYNPLAPSRLVFWVASPDAAAYRADALVPQLLGAGPTGVDLLVTRATEPSVVLTRSFDSRWGWVSREGSPALPPSGASREPLARMLAESARRAAGADFAFAYDSSPRAPTPTFTPGSIRLADLAALLYYEPIGVMTLTGAQLAEARLALAQTPEAHLQPEPDPARLDPKKSYRIAITGRQIWPVVGTTHLAPEAYVTTKFETASALLRSGFVGL